MASRKIFATPNAISECTLSEDSEPSQNWRVLYALAHQAGALVMPACGLSATYSSRLGASVRVSISNSAGSSEIRPIASELPRPLLHGIGNKLPRAVIGVVRNISDASKPASFGAVRQTPLERRFAGGAQTRVVTCRARRADQARPLAVVILALNQAQRQLSATAVGRVGIFARQRIRIAERRRIQPQRFATCSSKSEGRSR